MGVIVIILGWVVDVDQGLVLISQWVSWLFIGCLIIYKEHIKRKVCEVDKMVSLSNANIFFIAKWMCVNVCDYVYLTVYVTINVQQNLN